MIFTSTGCLAGLTCRLWHVLRQRITNVVVVEHPLLRVVIESISCVVTVRECAKVVDYTHEVILRGDVLELQVIQICDELR